MGSSDLQTGTLIQASGVATATATLTVPAGRRGYLLSCAIEVITGTVSFCRLQIQSAGSVVYGETFPAPAVATSAGAHITFPIFVAMTGVNQDLSVVATTTGATSTNIYAVVQLGP